MKYFHIYECVHIAWKAQRAKTRTMQCIIRKPWRCPCVPLCVLMVVVSQKLLIKTFLITYSRCSWSWTHSLFVCIESLCVDAHQWNIVHRHKWLFYVFFKTMNVYIYMFVCKCSGTTVSACMCICLLYMKCESSAVMNTKCLSICVFFSLLPSFSFQCLCD